MIPASFDYTRATDLDDALDALGESPGETRVLAGGQSLLPLLKARTTEATRLLDVGGLPELDTVEVTADGVRIGATRRLWQLAADPAIQQSCPPLATTVLRVADRQVRHWATVGGWIAHGDPRYDIGAILIALGGAVEVASRADGARTVPADELFVARHATSIRPSELLTSVSLPALDGRRCAYLELRRRKADPATVGVAVNAAVDGTMITDIRIGLTNLGETPLRATATEDALRWSDLGEEVRSTSVTAALRSDCSPVSDVYAGAPYRLDLAVTMLGRALAQLAAV